MDWLKFALLFLLLASLPALGYLAYRTWGAFTLEYWVDRNSVTISWANSRRVIPLQQIQRVIQGGLNDPDRASWRYWPASQIRPARALGLLDVTLYASRPLSECLTLDLGDVYVAISPREQELFLTALQERFRLRPVANVSALRLPTPIWRRIFEGNPLGAALLIAGFLGCLMLFGLLMVRFPDLPDALAFHYNSEGLPDVIREKSALFLLPAIGLLAWVLNGLWGGWMALRDQRTGAYMLWGGALIVQFCSLMALTSLMS
ncbi:MAG: DUF1648 domain-containing protein [Caldilineaceae bacterium]|nr:DUF1648 domain-containing protein [Caldilineaceae bacterium]